MEIQSALEEIRGHRHYVHYAKETEMRREVEYDSDEVGYEILVIILVISTVVILIVVKSMISARSRPSGYKVVDVES